MESELKWQKIEKYWPWRRKKSLRVVRESPLCIFFFLIAFSSRFSFHLSGILSSFFFTSSSIDAAAQIVVLQVNKKEQKYIHLLNGDAGEEVD